MKIEDQSLPMQSTENGQGIKRREFVKLGTGCALALAIGSAGLMQSCTVAKIYNTEVQKNQVMIPLSEFTKDKMRTIRIPKWKYDILVIKKTDQEYTALLLECTHRQYELNVNARGINCPAHGSAFDFEGKVRVGPANQPLKHYQTRIQGENLVLLIKD
jgi:Rieske Fe-S protein